LELSACAGIGWSEEKRLGRQSNWRFRRVLRILLPLDLKKLPRTIGRAADENLPRLKARSASKCVSGLTCLRCVLVYVHLPLGLDNKNAAANCEVLRDLAMKKYMIFCMMSAFAGALASTLLMNRSVEPAISAQDRSLGGTPRAITGEFAPDERVNIAVYEKVNRSVVNITTTVEGPNVMFFSFEPPPEGAGSGFVLDKEGHILTNNHVVEDAREIRVTLFNGESHLASLMGADPVYDMAVLRIDASRDVLHPVELGDSSRLKVGQKIYAIGNPFGLERTMTIGIISSLNRSLPAPNGRIMKSIIQIDAALNRGNSGGPLLDSRGRVIGINTAIASPSRTGENTGVGFAIPVNNVRRVVPQLIENGRVIRPDLGITHVSETEHGLVIAMLARDGPAERAGLRGFRVIRQQQRRGPFIFEAPPRIDRTRADTIVAVDGKPVRTADDLLSEIETKRPGDEVVLTVIREKRQVNVGVVLGAGD